jgi:hypothetical protein
LPEQSSGSSPVPAVPLIAGHGEHGPGFEPASRHELVIAYALAAISGAIVGFVCGALLSF